MGFFQEIQHHQDQNHSIWQPADLFYLGNREYELFSTYFRSDFPSRGDIDMPSQNNTVS
jgi:hypothetical protein